MCLTDQPERMNSWASQSSNSGCDGSAPLRPKSLARLDQSRAEMPLPDAIHHHARRQRIRRTGDPIGQRPPALQLRGILQQLQSVRTLSGTAGSTCPSGCSGSPRFSRWMSSGLRNFPAKAVCPTVAALILRFDRRRSARSIAVAASASSSLRPCGRRTPAALSSSGANFRRSDGVGDGAPLARRRGDFDAVLSGKPVLELAPGGRVPRRRGRSSCSAANSSSTQPRPGSLDIQLRELPYRPSLTNRNSCRSATVVSPDDLTVAPALASATLLPAVSKTSNSSRHGSRLFVAKIVNRTRLALAGGKAVGVPSRIDPHALDAGQRQRLELREPLFDLDQLAASDRSVSLPQMLRSLACAGRAPRTRRRPRTPASRSNHAARWGRTCDRGSAHSRCSVPETSARCSRRFRPASPAVRGASRARPARSAPAAAPTP